MKKLLLPVVINHKRLLVYLLHSSNARCICAIKQTSERYGELPCSKWVVGVENVDCGDHYTCAVLYKQCGTFNHSPLCTCMVCVSIWSPNGSLHLFGHAVIAVNIFSFLVILSSWKCWPLFILSRPAPPSLLYY